MSSSRLRALSYLAYRALVAHPFKMLAAEGSGLDRFNAQYAAEGLTPTSREDRAVGEAASACISCGLCEVRCELPTVVPTIRGLGLHAAFRLYARSAGQLRHARDAIEACAACDGCCDDACPTGVPISSIVEHLGRRVGTPATAADTGRA